MAITSDAAVNGDHFLASVLPPSTRPVGLVTITVPPSPNALGGCLVGRTARVMLKATRHDWFGALRTWLAL